ncbi:hypothetical protein ACIRQP_14945 [Streptomyces sp. NPDC102274]|uniref:hypothetical protein n=1 Tax=Streptomyces sp. NPDC102274 TaxID=3366151 RepID=UPI0038267481
MARTEKQSSTTSNSRSYLRPRGQETTPTPGAGRTDGRLRRGDEMLPKPRR